MLRNTEYNVVLDHVPETEYYKGSFSYRGGMLWNSLPNDIKASESKALFKENWLVGRQTVDYILLYFIICTYFKCSCTVFTSVPIQLSCKEVM